MKWLFNKTLQANTSTLKQFPEWESTAHDIPQNILALGGARADMIFLLTILKYWVNFIFHFLWISGGAAEFISLYSKQKIKFYDQ